VFVTNIWLDFRTRTRSTYDYTFYVIKNHPVYIYIYIYIYGPRGLVGIVTVYGLDGPESNPGGVFPPVQTGPGAHPTSCKMGTGSFSGVKCGRGVIIDALPLLVPRSWTSRAVPLPTNWAKPVM